MGSLMNFFTSAGFTKYMCVSLPLTIYQFQHGLGTRVDRGCLPLAFRKSSQCVIISALISIILDPLYFIVVLSTSVIKPASIGLKAAVVVTAVARKPPLCN